MGIPEKIKAIQDEMAKTQINKATEHHVGLLKAKMKRHEEALNCFENVCKKYPNNEDAFFQKGVQHILSDYLV